MSDESRQMIVDEVLSTVERLEDKDMNDPYEDIDPLDVRVDASLNGDVREITAVLATGGPHIEVDLFSGTVRGYWGGSEHSAPIFDETTEDQLRDLADYYLQYWEDCILA